MERAVDFLIVGGGMTAAAAAKAIRERAPKASIAVISSELYPPYDRPPLSKGLWKDGAERDVWRPIGEARVLLMLGRSAERIDRAAHVVEDDEGDRWKYGKLLLAVGGHPRKVEGDPGFLYFRTFDDYKRLRAAAKEGARAVVIGGGFIGSELAASLSANGCEVTMIFPEATIGARPFPKGLGEFVTGYYRERGVDVRTGMTVKSGRALEGGKTELTLSDGSRLEADVVVAGLGILPNVELAKAAGLTVDNGVVVDAHLRTSDPDIYAAGDVASFPAPALGRRLRAEHEDAALSTGERAGRCMTGEDAPYESLPFFYSDLFELGYEAVGVLDSRLETVEQWVTPNREGVIYYLEAGRVRGVLLWNTWGQVDAARALIADEGPFDAKSVLGKLPIAA